MYAIEGVSNPKVKSAKYKNIPVEAKPHPIMITNPTGLDNFLQK
jgi:hypothetical protein